MYIHMILPNTSQCTILTLKVIKGHLRSKKKMELNQSLTLIFFLLSMTNLIKFENVENQINHIYIVTPENNPECNLRLKIFLGKKNVYINDEIFMV